MQLVGRGCEGCGERVRAKLDAHGCLACDRAWHVDCLPDDREDDCPSCGRSFSEQEEEAREAARVVGEAARARGRRRFFGSVWLFVAAVLLASVGNFVVAGISLAAVGQLLIGVLPVILVIVSRQTHIVLPAPFVITAVRVQSDDAISYAYHEHVRLGISIGAVLGAVVGGVTAWSFQERLELVAINALAAVFYVLSAGLARSAYAQAHAYAADEHEK